MHYQYFTLLNMKNFGYLLILNLDNLRVTLFALNDFLKLNALYKPFFWWILIRTTDRSAV